MSGWCDLGVGAVSGRNGEPRHGATIDVCSACYQRMIADTPASRCRDINEPQSTSVAASKRTIEAGLHPVHMTLLHEASYLPVHY